MRGSSPPQCAAYAAPSCQPFWMEGLLLRGEAISARLLHKQLSCFSSQGGDHSFWAQTPIAPPI